MHGATTHAASADTERLIRATLAWLTRLPLLTEAQFSLLLGCGDGAARTALGNLHRRRLASSIVVDSPEFMEPLRLHYLTDAGAGAPAARSAVGCAPRAEVAPAARAELLAHLARVETAVGIADSVAMLADDLRRYGGDEGGAAIALEDAGSARWALHRGRMPATPPGVEAWARLRAGSLRATVLLAWDRAGAPRAHRRARLAAWYRADDDPEAPWGASLPPLLLVCPNARIIAEWEELLDGSAARRGRGLLRAACTTVPELTIRGPLDRIWRCPDGARAALLDLLVWEDAAAVRVRPSVTWAMWRPVRRQAPSASGGLGEGPCWSLPAIRPGAAIDGRTTAERPAALAIGLSATQKTLLGWVARHPLLPAGHLATFLELPEPAVTALLGGLARWGLIAVDATPGFADGVGPRYVLARRGAEFLAARDGVPLHRYLREGTIAVEGTTGNGPSGGRASAEQGEVRLMDLRRRPAHTAGVQHFALALAREAARHRAAGRDHRVLAWLNPVEGQAWFRHAGGTGHVWPDARFRYRADGVVYDLLLEWDRGLVRRRDYARKFTAYVAYLAGRPGGREDMAEVLRVVVVTPPAAAGRVRAELDRAAARSARLATAMRIITSDTVRGQRITEALR